MRLDAIGNISGGRAGIVIDRMVDGMARAPVTSAGRRHWSVAWIIAAAIAIAAMLLVATICNGQNMPRRSGWHASPAGARPQGAGVRT